MTSDRLPKKEGVSNKMRPKWTQSDAIFNPLFDTFFPSETLIINEKSKQLEAAGKTVFKFGFGQSPFPIPQIVQKSLQQNAHQKAYLPVQGLAALREQIANHFHELVPNVSWKADQVFIGPGSKELIFCIQYVLDLPLILPSPSWVTYAPQANLLKRTVHYVPTAKNQWKLQAEDLHDYILAHKVDRGLLLLNYPNNPTGLTYTPAELAAITQVCRNHGLLVLADEIYGLLDFSGQYHSISAFYPEGTIITSGISKWCGAGGWRLGLMLVPNKLKKMIDLVKIIASETFSAVSAPIQYAAITAYLPSAALIQYRQHCINGLKRVASYCQERLNEAGILTQAAQGGFYLFPNFGRYKREPDRFHNSAALCQHILEETGVILLPGSAFGRHENEYTARLCFVDFDGEQVLRHLEQNQHIGAEDFSMIFPKIKEGISRLVDWYQASGLTNDL